MRRLSFNKVLFDIKINMVLLMHHQITRHQMDLTLGIGRLHKGYKLGCLRQRLLSSPLKRGLGGTTNYTLLYPLLAKEGIEGWLIWLWLLHTV